MIINNNNVFVFLAEICLLNVSGLKLGQENTFTFTNDVNVTDLGELSPSLSYRVEGGFNVGVLWRDGDVKLLQFRLNHVKIFSKSQKTQETNERISLDDFSRKPFYAVLDKQSITDVYLEETEDISIANLKRSLISFFQYRNEDATVEEVDVSGQCSVSYVVWHNTAFTKTKLFCKIDTPGHRRVEQPVGVKINVFSSVEYNLAPDRITILTIDSTETYKITLNAYPSIGVSINSTFFLEATQAVGTLETTKCPSLSECVKQLSGVKISSLPSVLDLKKNQQGNLIQTIKENRKYLANNYYGKSDSAAAVLSLIADSREAKTEDWHKALNSRTGKELKLMLIDVLAATQTYESFKVAKENLKFNDIEDFEYVEKYLQGLAVGTRPNEAVFKELLEIFSKGDYYEKTKDTLVQTIASIGRHFANLENEGYDHPTSQDLSDFFLKQLADCTEDECRIIIVRALGNFRSPSTIKRLLETAHTSSNKVAVVALKSLKQFPKAYWNTDIIRENFFKIFYQIQRRHDSSTRTLALDILLEQKLTPDEIENLIEYLSSNDPAFEVKQYLIQKLQINAIKCSYYGKVIQAYLKQNPKYNNYHILGQGGLSTAILRKFSSKPSFDGYLFSVQEIKDGVLKRGTADIYIEGKPERSGLGADQFKIFTLGLFSDGLSSLMGGSGTDEDESETSPATAGMELAVQGTNMRPLIFFNGQGELMGHVWSGTASNPTPAYQVKSNRENYTRKL